MIDETSEYVRTREIVYKVACLCQDAENAIEQDRNSRVGYEPGLGRWNQSLHLVYLRIKTERAFLDSIHKRFNYDNWVDAVIEDESYFFTKEDLLNVVEALCDSLKIIHFSLFDFSVLGASRFQYLKRLFRDITVQTASYLEEVQDIKRSLDAKREFATKQGNRTNRRNRR